MIYAFFALALITSIVCIFLFLDFKTHRKYIFADVFMKDFELTEKAIQDCFEDSELIIDLFKERWTGLIAKKTLNLYIGKLIVLQDETLHSIRY